MQIYIKVTSMDNGKTSWYTETNKEMYLMDGDDLFVESKITGDIYCLGTPFNTIHKAKQAKNNALNLALSDGIADPVATLWNLKNNKLTQIKCVIK